MSILLTRCQNENTKLNDFGSVLGPETGLPRAPVAQRWINLYPVDSAIQRLNNHRAATQSVCVADCYFIVNVLDLPFASPLVGLKRP